MRWVDSEVKFVEPGDVIGISGESWSDVDLIGEVKSTVPGAKQISVRQCHRTKFLYVLNLTWKASPSPPVCLAVAPAVLDEFLHREVVSLYSKMSSPGSFQKANE